MTLEHQRVGGVKRCHSFEERQDPGQTAIMLLHCSPGSRSRCSSRLKLLRSRQVSGCIYSIEDSSTSHMTACMSGTGVIFIALFGGISRARNVLVQQRSRVQRQDVPDVFEWGWRDWERYRTGAKANGGSGSLTSQTMKRASFRRCSRPLHHALCTSRLQGHGHTHLACPSMRS